MSPENTAADFGTSLPFSQAAPFVYSMADAVSPASIICAGNRINSKQHTADRNADCDMVRVTPAFLDFSYRKPLEGCRSIRFVRARVLLSPCRAAAVRSWPGRRQDSPETSRHPRPQLSHRASGSPHD